MAETTNISDLPSSTSGNQVVQQNNVTMDVTYNPSIPQSQTINPQTQQQNNPQIQNQVSSQPNMTYSEVIKSMDNKGPESIPMNNGNTMTNILQNMENIAKTGAFDLPSRDIPIQENRIDMQTQPNYVPEAKNYIQDYETHEHILNESRREANKKDSMELIFEKIQVPLLIALIYFFFHLPSVNKAFLTHCAFCFHKDGNMNLNGYILKSVAFAGLYFIINMIFDTFNGI